MSFQKLASALAVTATFAAGVMADASTQAISETITVKYEVQTSSTIDIAAKEINLNKSKPSDDTTITLTSNQNGKLTVQPLNGSLLNGSASIPYTFEINGSEYKADDAKTTPVSAVDYVVSNNQTSAIVNVKFTAKPNGDETPGEYSDTVNIVFQAS